MILADVSPGVLEMGIFVASATGILIFLNQGGQLIDRFRDKTSYVTKAEHSALSEELSQLRIKEFSDLRADMVSKSEHADLVEEFSKLRAEVNMDRQAVQNAAEARANRIYDQVNILTKSVSELSGVISEIRRPKQ